MTRPVRLVLAGAGLVGRRHLAAVAAAPAAALAAIADPDPAARALAEARGAAWCPDLETALDATRPDAVILATPNAAHEAGALLCIARGLPVLVEKPLATDSAAGARIVAAAEAAGVPVLTGHHRRHMPLVARARALIDEGRLGRIVAVEATTWLAKPAEYFDTPWRRQPGAGPILVNLIHDIDLVQHLAGPVAEVTALASSAARGFAVEDTAAILLRFASGALGTMTLSDSIAAPWSWELTAGENPAYPATSESAYRIGGTRGSLSLPDLRLWSHDPAAPSWWDPISATSFPVERTDPVERQLANFCAVIRGAAAPVVSARDGLAALALVEAVAEAARSGRTVRPADRPAPEPAP